MNRIHITKGSGKMEGIYSINTPSSSNPFCKQISKTSDICKVCYAMRAEMYRKNLIPAFQRNERLFLDESFVPESIPHKVIRFHSFGELHNRTHLNNFIKLAIANPSTHFTLWTKRSNIVQDYFREGGIKPSNMVFIYSNPALDNERKTPPKWFDKIFNVHTKKGIEENGIEINCEKSCASCMLCYSRNDVKVINEKIK